MLFNRKIKTAAGCADYDESVGIHGTANDRCIRAEAWFEANPDKWVHIEPPPAMSWAARQAFKYKVEQPQPPPVITLDSRPTHEGYGTWNFETNHPANRR